MHISGISLPGNGEEPKAPVYVDGRLANDVARGNIVAEFIAILDEYVDSHYSAAADKDLRPWSLEVSEKPD